jgi:hypothetical protein
MAVTDTYKMFTSTATNKIRKFYFWNSKEKFPPSKVHEHQASETKYVKKVFDNKHVKIAIKWLST